MTSRRVLVPALAGGGALALAALFVALGLWQLQRRSWKQELIAQVDARAHAAPVPLPSPAEWASFSPARDGYRRVVVEGRLLRDDETLVRATTALGSGYWVMTPLRTSEGTVLVNLGFIPPERRDARMRGAACGDGVLRLTGLLRASEPGGGFLRSNDAAHDRWYSRDVAAIAARRGLDDAAPFFVDVEAGPNAAPCPVGGLTVIRFTDHHLIYALTWFGLALLSAWACLVFLFGRRER